MSPARFLAHLAAVALGVVAAEAFTRLTIEPDAMFEIAFSMGAQQPDEKYGMVYTPGFEGYMRHPDKVWTVPITLDEYGFRPHAETPNTTPDERTDVVLISGRSMTMCYGLPQAKTIQARMVAQSDEPLAVYNTGWAGIDPWRAWNYYLDTLDVDVDVDVALFCLNPAGFEPYALLPEDLSSMPKHPAMSRFFYMLPGNIRMPKDALEDWMGPNYFKSYVLYGLLRYRTMLDDDVFSLIPQSLREGPGAIDADALEAAGASVVATSDEAIEGRKRFQDFVAMMRAHFEARGAKFGLVFLVSRGFPRDAFEPFHEALPDDVPRIDLQMRLRDRMDPRDFIGMGHYDAEHVRMIADELDAFVRGLEDGTWRGRGPSSGEERD